MDNKPAAKFTIHANTYMICGHTWFSVEYENGDSKHYEYKPSRALQNSIDEFEDKHTLEWYNLFAEIYLLIKVSAQVLLGTLDYRVVELEKPEHEYDLTYTIDIDEEQLESLSKSIEAHLKEPKMYQLVVLPTSPRNKHNCSTHMLQVLDDIGINTEDLLPTRSWVQKIQAPLSLASRIEDRLEDGDKNAHREPNSSGFYYNFVRKLDDLSQIKPLTSVSECPLAGNSADSGNRSL